MATLGGAIRTAIVSMDAVADRVYRDRAPDEAVYPFMTFVDMLGDTPAIEGDGGLTMGRRRTLQFSLWFRRPQDVDDALIRRLRTELDGLRVLSEERAFRIKVSNVTQPIPDPDGEVQVVYDLRLGYVSQAAGLVAGGLYPAPNTFPGPTTYPGA